MKVSALTQIHNRVDLFAETIASVLAQSYPVHELIIIDDGSTENVKALVDSFNDSRLKYFYYKRVGVISKLRNIAISKASGDVLAFIDSDDIWHKEKIKCHVEDMIATGSVISFSDCQLFNTQGIIGPNVCASMRKTDLNIFTELTERNQTFAFGTNLFLKKNIDGREVRCDEKLFIGEHDLITMISAKHKATYIDQVLNYIRRHERNVSKENSVIDILSPLEYNYTIGKLVKENLIATALYKKIKSSNYSKVALTYMNRGRYRTALNYVSAALSYNFKWSYFKLYLKLAWFRLKA